MGSYWLKEVGNAENLFWQNSYIEFLEATAAVCSDLYPAAVAVRAPWDSFMACFGHVSSCAASETGFIPTLAQYALKSPFCLN